MDIDLTNEDQTGTHLLLKLLLNSALQHSSSFDAKIQNLFSRATAKGNQFIYMEYVIKVNKVNTYTNSCSRYLSEAIEPKDRLIVNIVSLGSRVAELGSLSSGAERAMKISIKRVFKIFVTNTLF